jgi:nitrite reductase/ring-hydroxylating ferredoxin subunit
MTRRIPLPPYPRGWFAVASSDELAAGAVRPLRCFGRELVLFRTESGAAQLFDAHCPHLGAHLGHGGRIAGEELVCPFHGWRFGRDGACTAMPYGRRIPASARAKRWAIREQGGVILAWCAGSDEPAQDAVSLDRPNAEGAEPDWEMPRFEESHWTPPVSRSWIIRGHPQEVCENSADLGHFRFVHGSHLMRATAEPKLDGPFFELAIESDPDGIVPELRLADHPVLAGSSFCFGPGLTAANLTAKGSPLLALQRLYVTPIDDERIELRGVVNVGRLADPAATEVYAKGLSEAVFAQWEADVLIWEHKLYREKPALNDAESALAAFRRWYAQFYAWRDERGAPR